MGVDIAERMLVQARGRDPQGEYHLVADGKLDQFEPGTFDFVSSLFTFDNIPSMKKKVALFRSLGQLLKDDGCILSMVSPPEIYFNEWASFSTRDFPENHTAASGDTVRIVMLDVEDKRPVEDIIWTDEDYLEVYQRGPGTDQNVPAIGVFN